MQVVQAVEFGGPDVLAGCEAPSPTAGPGQVLVAVAAVDTLFLDCLVRRGAPGPWSVRPPYVPGMGVAGQVMAVGAGVDTGWIGRRIAARPGTSRPESGNVAEAAAGFAPTGGYAERAVVDVDAVVPVPDDVGLPEAAALINDGLTAMQISGAAMINPGEHVLVQPAGGGLGSLLVQLAHSAGATVIAAARGRRKLDLAHELGADVTVDYSDDGWTTRVAEVTNGAGLDVVLDGVGGAIGRAAFEVTAGGGRFYAFGSPSGAFAPIEPAEAQQRDITVVGLMELPLAPGDNKRLPIRALAEAADGLLRPTIGKTLPLARAAEAHTAIEGRAVVGKTLLLP